MLPISSIGALGRTPMTGALAALGGPPALPGGALGGAGLPLGGSAGAGLGTAGGVLGGTAGTGTAGKAGTGTAGLGDSGPTFVNTLGEALNSLNAQLSHADASMADFASGGSSDLHTVMLEMQEAAIGLKVGIQVRDRLLEAYQEIMRLQI